MQERGPRAGLGPFWAGCTAAIESRSCAHPPFSLCRCASCWSPREALCCVHAACTPSSESCSCTHQHIAWRESFLPPGQCSWLFVWRPQCARSTSSTSTGGPPDVPLWPSALQGEGHCRHRHTIRRDLLRCMRQSRGCGAVRAPLRRMRVRPLHSMCACQASSFGVSAHLGWVSLQINDHHCRAVSRGIDFSGSSGVVTGRRLPAYRSLESVRAFRSYFIGKAPRMALTVIQEPEFYFISSGAISCRDRLSSVLSRVRGRHASSVTNVSHYRRFSSL